VRVLRHQKSCEGFFQNGLAQGFGLLQRGGEGEFELIDFGQPRLQMIDYEYLLFLRTDGNYYFFNSE